MCGRYTLHKKADEIGKRFNIAQVPPDIHDNFNVAPSQQMPVIIDQGNGPQLEIMRWGLIPSWAKDPSMSQKLINARADGIFEKPVWRSIILKRRCLIPADGFYEWKRSTDPKGPKTPYYIRPAHEELFAFAGVWESWKDSDGLEWKTYSIITTEPNIEMSKVHNRMPVILHREDESSWLEPSHIDRGSIEPLLRPYEDNGLEMYEVSRDVNSVGNNEEMLIYPLSDQ